MYVLDPNGECVKYFNESRAKYKALNITDMVQVNIVLRGVIETERNVIIEGADKVICNLSKSKPFLGMAECLVFNPHSTLFP